MARSESKSGKRGCPGGGATTGGASAAAREAGLPTASLSLTGSTLAQRPSHVPDPRGTRTS